MSLSIKESAIFIADAHYNHERTDLKKLLEQIKLGEVKTTQLFLMGDIFDFIAEQITYFRAINNSVVELINEISNDIEVIYIEGNHDYNVAGIFPKVKVYPLSSQPVSATFKEKKVALSHGDIFISRGYEIYTNFIRNKFLLKTLNILDRCNFISMNVEKWLGKKDKSYKFSDFNSFAKSRIQKYEDIHCDMIIEGHFHQGASYEGYTNIPALVDYQYLQIIDGEMQFIDFKV